MTDAADDVTNEALKLKFRRLHMTIIHSVDAAQIINFLFQEGVLGARSTKSLMLLKNDPEEQCSQLLALLHTAEHPEAFVQLRRALENEPHLAWLVKRIDEYRDQEVPLHQIGDQPGGDGRDDARRLNEQLVSELNAAQDDMKRLRQVIDQMAREYEAAKELDVFRRYGVLKRTVKRTVMHLRLHQNSAADDQNASVVVAVATTAGKMRTRDELRKRTDHVNSLSAQELCEENEELTEQIKEFRRRTAMLRILIEELEQSYEESKRFVVVQRYRLMKSMIKRVTQSSLI